MRQDRSKGIYLRWIAVAAATGLVLAVGAAVSPGIDAAIVPMVAGVLLLLAVCRAVRPADVRSARLIMTVAVAAFFAHVLIGILIGQSANFAHSLGSDATTYDSGARMIVDHWRQASSPLPPMSAGKEGFYYTLGALYWAFGPFQLAGLALNAFFAAALVPLLFDLTRRLFGDDAGWWAVVVVTLQPGLLVWPSQLLREAGVLFFLVVALSCANRLATRASFSGALLLAIDVGLFLTFRADVALIVAVGLAVGLTLGRRQVVGGFLIATTVLAMGVVLVVAVGLGRAGYRSSTTQTLSQVSAARTDLATTAASGFDRTANVSTPGRALKYLPKGLPSFLWGPFPWQVRNVPQLFVGLDALTVMALTPSIWRGWRRARLSIGRRRLLLVLPAGALAVALALLIGNYGTVVRERLQILVLLVPLAAAGISQRRAERAGERVTSPPRPSFVDFSVRDRASVGQRPPLASGWAETMPTDNGWSRGDTDPSVGPAMAE